MRFAGTAIPGVVVVETDPQRDARGLFARRYRPEAFASAGIDFRPTVQVNISTNVERLTLRGMHFQKPPFAEAKLVRVVRGRAWDVALDLRPGPGWGRWTARELTADGMEARFLPEGVAHGLLTLEPDTHILLQIPRCYVPGHADEVRRDDPAFGTGWPEAPSVLADQDRAWPDFRSRADLR